MIKVPKTFCFNFSCPKDVDESLKHEIELQKVMNLLLKIKTLTVKNYCQNISMKTIFMNTENS